MSGWLTGRLDSNGMMPGDLLTRQFNNNISKRSMKRGSWRLRKLRGLSWLERWTTNRAVRVRTALAVIVFCCLSMTLGSHSLSNTVYKLVLAKCWGKLSHFPLHPGLHMGTGEFVGRQPDKNVVRETSNQTKWCIAPKFGWLNDSCHTCSVPKDIEVMVCSSRMFTKDLLVIVSCSCLSNNEPLVMVSSSVLSYSDRPVMVCSSCLSRKAFSFRFFCKQNHFDEYRLCANTLGSYSMVKDVRQYGYIPKIPTKYNNNKSNQIIM